MARLSGGTYIATEEGCAEQLARFFPACLPKQLPAVVKFARAGNGSLKESVVVEFGGPEHAIFVSTLPLEFNDRIQLVGESKGDTAAASVVAVQYHEGRKAIAVRFVGGPCHWVTQT